ncbi:hypothetical protein [Calycomorphotria hydatis]|nr:hypothetical protein [Calycomorphotria hydatis]
MLIEDTHREVPWTQPKDMSVKRMLKVFKDEKLQSHFGGNLVTFADGNVRLITNQIEPVLLKTMANCGGRRFPGDRAWPDHLSVSSAAGNFYGEPLNITELANSEIVASPVKPLKIGHTTMWCAISQLGWDAISRNVCGDENMAVLHSTETSDQFSKWKFDAANLDDVAYTTEVDVNGGRSAKRVNETIREQFPNALPNVETEVDTSDYPVMRVYSYLQKDLPFQDELDALHDSLTFQFGENGAQMSRVSAFGRTPMNEGDGFDLGKPVADMNKQIKILDYIDDDNFIVQLSTDSRKDDRVVLAKVPCGDDLAKTWEIVGQRIKKPSQYHDRFALMSVEPMQIPVMEVNVSKFFPELCDRKHEILCAGSTSNGFWIDELREDIRFRIDETGSSLIAGLEGRVIGSFGGEEQVKPPPKMPRRFIFNRPFLLALIEKDATYPYFLAWIGNADIMVPHVLKEE